MAAGAGGHGHLRASHADREQVIGTLKAAYVQGRLAKDDLDLRVGQALAARTYADLAAVTADLPAGLAAAKPRQPVVQPRRVIAVATALYAGAWASALFLSPYGAGNPPIPALLFSGSVVYLGVLIISVTAMLANWRDRRSGGQPPQRPGRDGPDWRLPPAGPGWRLPPTDPGHWHIAEAS
jgi:hypothetical protein